MRASSLASCLACAALLLAGAALAQGQQIYQQNCAVCHGNNGQGASGPPLANNPNLADTTYVLDQILNGGQAMPPFRSQLDDEQVAAVATHIRTSWGNDFGEVTPQQSASVRAGGEAGEADDQAQAPEGDDQAQAPAGDDEARQDGEGAEAADAPSATIGVSGSILVDGEGMTLYRYVYEAPEGEPLCYLNCLNRWVPVLVSGGPQAGEGVEAGDLGAVEREDGGRQATYRGWPLYRFSGDEASGDTMGDEISDVWTPVGPGLEAVGESTGLPEGEENGQE